MKAIVRALSDDELIIAQGVENSAREDLSFIERAVFALRLEDRRAQPRSHSTGARHRSGGGLQTHFRGEAVPNDLILAIGKAPKIGRGRWQEFAEALQDKSALKRAQAAAALPAFAKVAATNVCAGAERCQETGNAQTLGRPIIEIKDATGRTFAEVRASERDVKVTLAKQTGSAFAQFLTLRLPSYSKSSVLSEPGDGESKGS